MYKPEVVTIGLGYIGLPTSALIAKNKIKVLGVDINQQAVDTINAGSIHIYEPDLEEIVSAAVNDNYLVADVVPVSAKVYLIVVPTPFKGNHEPDISYVEAATKSVLPFLKKDDLFIIESTSPVGTTEKIASLIYSERPELENTISIAYCPERVLPGNIMHELVHNDRVIGGLDDTSTKKAVQFYKRFVKGDLFETNARTAEMCKLVENSSRDVQIAFANELSFICDKANINVWELIRLANKHPRVNILQPGCGVGGHCIAVDPYFIVSHYPLESRLIGRAREINNYKAFWCVEKINNEILKFQNTHNRKPKVALMGLAFKPNIDDLRESPAKYIVERVLQNFEGEQCLIVEPNVTSFKDEVLESPISAFDQADIVALLVAHDEFKKFDLSTGNKIILDFCGVAKKKVKFSNVV